MSCGLPNSRLPRPRTASPTKPPIHDLPLPSTACAPCTCPPVLQGFQRDSLLNPAEEQQLASAAQDFMELQALQSIMTSLLRRPPRLAELAEAIHCDEE